MQPEALKLEADQRFFYDTLDEAAALAHGRHSGEGGPGAPRSVEDGAKTPVWLALAPDDGPMGGFFRDEAAVPW